VPFRTNTVARTDTSSLLSSSSSYARVVVGDWLCLSSSSVTPHSRPAGGFNHTGQVMTSCCLQSNYSSHHNTAWWASTITSRHGDTLLYQSTVASESTQPLKCFRKSPTAYHAYQYVGAQCSCPPVIQNLHPLHTYIPKT